MEWKTFGIKGKLTSAKRKVLSVIRLIGSLENRRSNVSSSNSEFAEAPYESLKMLKNFALEAELKKAETLWYWRRCMDHQK